MVSGTRVNVSIAPSTRPAPTSGEGGDGPLAMTTPWSCGGTMETARMVTASGPVLAMLSTWVNAPSWGGT